MKLHKSTWWLMLISLLLGLIVLSAIIQSNKQCKEQIESVIKTAFAQSFACQADGHLQAINIFSGNLTAINIAAQAPDSAAWQWKAKKLTISWSWLNAFFMKVLPLEVTLTDIQAESIFDGHTLALNNHLKNLLEGLEGLPITLQSLRIVNGNLHITDTTGTRIASLTLQCDSLFKTDSIKLTGTITNGSCSLGFGHQAHTISSQFTIKYKKGCLVPPLMHLRLQGQTTLDQCKSFKAAFDWNNVTGHAYIAEENDSWHLALPNLVQSKDTITATYQGTIPLELLGLLYGIHPNTAQAMVHSSGSAIINETGWSTEGSLKLANLHRNSLHIADIETNFTRDNSGLWNLKGHAQNNFLSTLEAQAVYDETTQDGSFTLTNAQTITLPGFYWTITPQSLHIQTTLKPTTGIRTEYSIALRHEKLAEDFLCKGTVNATSSTTTFTGSLGDITFQGAWVPTKTQWFSAYAYDQDRTKLMSLESDSSGIAMNFDHTLLKKLAWLLCEYELKGHGTYQVHLSYNNNLEGSVSLKNANIPIVPTYNSIQSCTAKFNIDMATQTITCSDVLLNLYKGIVETKRALIHYNQHLELESIHCPVVISNVLTNLQKDFFGVISGTLLLEKKQTNPICLVTGKLSIEKGQLKKNILSHSLQQNLITSLQTMLLRNDPRLQVALTISTHQPLHISTSFLESQVVMSLHSQGSISDPRISGNVTLHGGTLAFPYKPLYITRGSLQLLPGQEHNPLIELTAKGSIKKYYITMHIDGSLQQPHISFESNPALTQEQIIMLLLSGSEKGSLMLAMPSMIMQQIEQLLFDPEQTQTKLDHYLKTILSPFKNIRIVPSFSDLSGRGGFKGSLEIDVSDQLHASLQKNFGLPEDTKFELEYYLSDDITIRGIRDEHSDLGGEVELRWKF